MANDVFHYLGMIERSDYKAFAEMNADTIKAVPPFTLLLWLQGASKNRDVMVYTSNFSNCNFFSFSKHPILQYMMLVANAGGIPQGRVKFRKPNMGGENKTIKAISEHFLVSFDVAKMYLEDLDQDEVDDLLWRYEERHK